MSRWRPVLGLALLAFVTAACAARVGGIPTAVAPSSPNFPNPDRIQAEDALGDLTMWNPCSVVDPDALPESWTGTVDVPVAFEFCALAVTTDEGTKADIDVGYLYRSTDDLDDYEKRPGGLTVVPQASDGVDCTRDIVFAYGIALAVRSYPDDPDDAAKMCAISDEVVEHVIDAVVAGDAESLSLPKNSLGHIDPCELVTDDVTIAVAGITKGAEPENRISRHGCWWDSPTDGTLNVQFEIGHLPDGDSGKTSQGRYTTVTRYEDDETSSLCAVNGEHVKFAYGSETGLMERVAIYLYLKPGQVEAACVAASQIADKLWPKLPPL
jgi:hypothetical protein